MRHLALALVLALLAGCAAPDALPEPQEGPIDLTGQSGLLLVDRETRAVVLIESQQALAWMAPGASLISWTDASFATVLNRTSGAREIGPLVVWARIYDNGTALELAPGEAKLREIQSGNTLTTRPLGPTPHEGAVWSGASDDLSVLALEIQGERPLACINEIVIRSDVLDRTRGCHLRVAGDGRVGWTESTAVRMREADGEIVNVTARGSGNPANNTFVAHENPIFTLDGIVMLRITGGERVALTEVVDGDGDVWAKMSGSRRLALHDVSEDGRYLLLRAFDR